MKGKKKTSGKQVNIMSVTFLSQMHLTQVSGYPPTSERPTTQKKKTSYSLRLPWALPECILPIPGVSCSGKWGKN